jgi:hypothetical protein
MLNLDSETTESTTEGVSLKRGLGACPPENFGFFETQISYFQHFEEFSNKNLTLH